MMYLCPKCKNTMVIMATASIPSIITYECMACGYTSKPIKENQSGIVLPKELQEESEVVENGD